MYFMVEYKSLSDNPYLIMIGILVRDILSPFTRRSDYPSFGKSLYIHTYDIQYRLTSHTDK